LISSKNSISIDTKVGGDAQPAALRRYKAMAPPATEQTFIDVIEEVLGVPFEPRYLRPIDFPIAKKLAHRLKNFYESYELPPKSDKELRPYLSPRYTTTQSLGSDLYRGGVHFKNFEYKFDPAKAHALAPQLKTYLLYCHSVCIYDALPPLLDYFRLSDDSYSSARLPAVNHLLHEYAGLSALFRRHILVPVCDEVFGNYTQNSFWPNETEQREIQKNLPQLRDQPDRRALGDLLGSLVKEHWWLKQHVSNRIDLYFPHRDYVGAFQGLMNALEERFSRDNIIEPFNVGILGSLTEVNPNHISAKDILEVRQEGLFEEFRAFLGDVFDDLNTSTREFSDFDAEFASAVRREMSRNREKIDRLTRKSNFFRELFRRKDLIMIGAAAGIVAGLNDTHALNTLLYGAIGGAVPPLYDAVRGTISSNSPARTSMRHHFLAIDPDKRSWPR
jgi:hypothetical protein